MKEQIPLNFNPEPEETCESLKEKLTSLNHQLVDSRRTSDVNYEQELLIEISETEKKISDTITESETEQLNGSKLERKDEESISFPLSEADMIDYTYSKVNNNKASIETAITEALRGINDTGRRVFLRNQIRKKVQSKLAR